MPLLFLGLQVPSKSEPQTSLPNEHSSRHPCLYDKHKVNRRNQCIKFKFKAQGQKTDGGYRTYVSYQVTTDGSGNVIQMNVNKRRCKIRLPSIVSQLQISHTSKSLSSHINKLKPYLHVLLVYILQEACMVNSFASSRKRRQPIQCQTLIIFHLIVATYYMY